MYQPIQLASIRQIILTASLVLTVIIHIWHIKCAFLKYSLTNILLFKKNTPISMITSSKLKTRRVGPTLPVEIPMRCTDLVLRSSLVEVRYRVSYERKSIWNTSKVKNPSFVSIWKDTGYLPNRPLATSGQRGTRLCGVQVLALCKVGRQCSLHQLPTDCSLNETTSITAQ